jgi:hypothetical protein
MVTWWWWLEFDDRTTSASGRETRDAAITDAKRRARERGVTLVLRDLDPSRGASAFVERDAPTEMDPKPEERHDERDVAEDPRDHAGDRRDEHRQDEG